MERKEKWLAATVLAFGTVYTVTTLKLPRAVVGNPMGPLYFPLAFGILTIVIGLVMLIQDLRNMESSTHEKKAAKKGALNIVFGASLCLVYALLFSRIGFFISTVLFLTTFLFMLNGPKRWFMNVSVAVLYTVGVWYLFEKVFLIDLP